MERIRRHRFCDVVYKMMKKRWFWDVVLETRTRCRVEGIGIVGARRISWVEAVGARRIN